MPKVIEQWSLTSFQELLIKTGAQLLQHARIAMFQITKAVMSHSIFQSIASLIKDLRGTPADSSAR